MNLVDALDGFGIDSFEEAPQTAGIRELRETDDLLKSTVALKNLCLA